MNTNKSPSFQKFEQFINDNNITQLQVYFLIKSDPGKFKRFP